MRPINIGVISDTHYPDQPFPFEAISSAFRGVDRIIHAGDMTVPSIIKRLSEIAPVDAVRGNCDHFLSAEDFPQQMIVTVAGGHRIGVTHQYHHPMTADAAACMFGDKDLTVIVFGHTHQAYYAQSGSITFFNPGAPVRTQRTPRPSVGIISLTGQVCQGRHIYL